MACAGPIESPNIVVLLIDTLRADRLGTYGYDVPTSPNIDALSRESVVFDRAHAPGPWTLPSVASIMTSLPLCEHAVLRDGQRIPESARTLAERLRDAGYVSAAFLKNPYAGALSGLDRGFDTSELLGEGQPVWSDLSAEWLDRRGDEPFLLYLHAIAPHNPSNAATADLEALGYRVKRARRKKVERMVARYRRATRVDSSNDAAPGTTDNTDQQTWMMGKLKELGPAIHKLYDAQVRRVDRRIGEVMAELRERDLWEESLVVVVSDHGEEMGEHGGWQHDQSVYEELIHVPLIIKFPGGRHAGRRISAPVSLLDLLPTVLDAVGRPDLARGARGRSLLPLLEQEAAEVSDRRVTSLRHNRKKYFRPFKETRGDLNVVVMDGGWKAIYNIEPGSIELYDLASDPGEARDLSMAEPERAEALRRAAERYYRECVSRRREPASDVTTIDKAQEDALRSLGYVQ